jgi:nicotinamide-nucleotide amidase
MKVEIITIGDELLWGQTADANASYLGRRLVQLGLPPHWQTTIGDDPEIIKAALGLAVQRADVVLMAGGLGPTDDDRTRGALSQALGRPLVLDESLWHHIRRRLTAAGWATRSAHQRLALVPRGARPLPNAIGLAPGLRLEAEGSSIYVLPGVPQEMRAIFEEQVVPVMERIPTDTAIRRKRLRTVGIGETELAEKIRSLRLREVTVSYLPGPCSVDLWLTARAPLGREAEDLLTRAGRRIEENLEEQIYGTDDDTLERITAALLIMKGLTIATAESCTGGLLADRLTDVPGSSAYFKCGLVAYSNQAKRQILKVPKRILDRYGAVSSEVAAAMAVGAVKIGQTDIGLSTTGIAGPTGETADKPVGLVYIGVAHRDHSFTGRFQFAQDRSMNKECATRIALNMIRQYLLNL